jgi:hypothetical protein
MSSSQDTVRITITNSAADDLAKLVGKTQGETLSAAVTRFINAQTQKGNKSNGAQHQ